MGQVPWITYGPMLSAGERALACADLQQDLKFPLHLLLVSSSLSCRFWADQRCATPLFTRFISHPLQCAQCRRLSPTSLGSHPRPLYDHGGRRLAVGAMSIPAQTRRPPSLLALLVPTSLLTSSTIRMKTISSVDRMPPFNPTTACSNPWSTLFVCKFNSLSFQTLRCSPPPSSYLRLGFLSFMEGR